MTFTPSAIAAAQGSHKAFYPKGPFASVSLAQWALESDYGKFLSGKNNSFGIKATKAQIAAKKATLRWTHETLHGQYVKVAQWFADYDTELDCFMAHAHLLATSGYYTTAQHAANPKDYAMALQGIYATGIPGHPYGPALILIMDQNNLYQYDKE